MAAFRRSLRELRPLRGGRHARRVPSGPTRSPWRFALVGFGIVLVAAPMAIAGSTDRPDHGLLSVTTAPSVDSAISVDGTVRNTGELQGLQLGVGNHEVCFSPVEDYLAPECMVVTLEDGVHTTVTGTFTPAGTVVVVAEPVDVDTTVIVDGVERDKGSATLTLAAGEHTVCWSDASGYTAPDCQDVVLEAGQTVTVVGTYTRLAATPSDPATSPDEDPSPPAPDGPTATNLLTWAQHTFDAESFGWVPQGNTIVAQTDAGSFDEAGALVVRVSESGPWPDNSRTARVGTSPGKHDGVPVTPGVEYTGSARVLSLDGATEARCELRWYSAAGKQRIIHTDAGAMTDVGEREWTALQCNATAPASAVAASLRVVFGGVDFGRSFLVDDAWLVEGLVDDANPPSDLTEDPTSEPTPEPTPDPTPTTDPEPTEEPAPEPTEEPSSEPVSPPPSSFPDASNTGVVDESALRPSASVTSTHDGQVIENLEVTGAIQVKHDNVTVRNVRVLGTGLYGISVPHTLHDAVTGLLIEDVEIAGVSGDRSAGLVHYGRWTARRVNVHGYEDAVKMGTGQVLEDSYLHGLHKTATSHNDGLQIQSGHGSVVRGNSIVNDYTQTSAIMLQTNFGAIDNWLIEGNRFHGGGYTMYLEDKGNGHGPPTNVTVRGNVWDLDSAHWGPVRIKNRHSSLRWENNTYDDGTAFNPS